LNRASGSAVSAPEPGQDEQDLQDDVLLPSYFFLPLGILSILLILSAGEVAAR